MEQEQQGWEVRPPRHMPAVRSKDFTTRQITPKTDGLARRPTPIYEGRKLQLPGPSKERSRHLLWARLPAVYQTLQKADRLYGAP